MEWSGSGDVVESEDEEDGDGCVVVKVGARAMETRVISSGGGVDLVGVNTVIVVVAVGDARVAIGDRRGNMGGREVCSSAPGCSLFGPIAIEVTDEDLLSR